MSDPLTSVLECSSRGDKRFSALFAKISVNDKFDSIETHYQTSKVFRNENGDLFTVSKWKDAKGKKPIAFKIGGFYLPIRFGLQFYNLMWYKYLKSNNVLEQILLKYNDYNDIFSNGNLCSQSNSIRSYMQDEFGVKYLEKMRGKNLYNECIELIEILSNKNCCVFENEDLLNSYGHIIGHQVNAQGKMGGGVASVIKKEYPKAYLEYLNLFKINNDSSEKMGKCQIVDCGTKIIANLFGQKHYGRDKSIIYTNYDKLEEALIKLKDFAKKNNLIVSIPYNIGCGLANGDWDKKVLPLIKKSFKDYYVIIYKKPLNL